MSSLLVVTCAITEAGRRMREKEETKELVMLLLITLIAAVQSVKESDQEFNKKRTWHRF